MWGDASPSEFRVAVRRGEFRSPTPSVCRGYVQANLVGLPEEYLQSFVSFCEKNPAPCPVLEVIPPGSSGPSKVARDADLYTDVPLYDIFRNGRFIETVDSIEFLRAERLGFVLLGCSFSFELALEEEGIPVRHVELGRNVPMFRTEIPLIGVGSFEGHMIVSMRPIPHDRVVDAVLITSRYPLAHGAPVQIGYPEMIGIRDVMKPDFGDAVPFMEGEIPVFWACGVTPRVVIEISGIPLAVTHHPGHMFVTDLLHSDIEGKASL